jgi:hypothetical protein
MNELIHRGIVKENGTNPKKRACAAGAQASTILRLIGELS